MLVLFMLYLGITLLSVKEKDHISVNAAVLQHNGLKAHKLMKANVWTVAMSCNYSGNYSSI